MSKITTNMLGNVTTFDPTNLEFLKTHGIEPLSSYEELCALTKFELEKLSDEKLELMQKPAVTMTMMIILNYQIEIISDAINEIKERNYQL